MKPEEYPVEPPEGISHFPKGILYLVKQEDTGKETVKIKRISGNEFEFEITPKILTLAEQKDFPIRIYKKKKEKILKFEKKVDLTKENKHRVNVEEQDILAIGNTVIYMAGYGLIVMSTTEIDPCTFQVLRQADIDNGWGVVFKQSESQYFINCSLLLASGYFIDTEKQVEFGDSSYVQISGNFHLRLGEVASVDEHTGKKGCSIILHPYSGQTCWMNTQAADVELYNTEVLLKGGQGNGIVTWFADNNKTFRIWGSRFRGGEYIQVQHLNYAEGKYAVAHTDIEKFHRGLMMTGTYSSTFLTDVRIIEGYSGLEFLGSHGATVYGLEFIDNDVLAKFSGSYGVYNLINCKKNATWTFGSIGLCEVNQQYNFDLKVTDKSNNAIGNANVKIWNVDGILVADVDTYPVGHVNEGEIPTQILTYKEYPSQDIKTPCIIKISKLGYKIYDTSFAMNRLIDFEIGLKRIAINTDNETIL